MLAIIATLMIYTTLPVDEWELDYDGAVSVEGQILPEVPLPLGTFPAAARHVTTGEVKLFERTVRISYIFVSASYFIEHEYSTGVHHQPNGEKEATFRCDDWSVDWPSLGGCATDTGGTDVECWGPPWAGCWCRLRSHDGYAVTCYFWRWCSTGPLVDWRVDEVLVVRFTGSGRGNRR